MIVCTKLIIICFYTHSHVCSHKLTLDEATAAVIDHARSPSVMVSSSSCEDSSNNHSTFIVMSEDLQEHWTVGNDGIVKSWSGPLLCYDMKGWKRVQGGFTRPTPAYCIPTKEWRFAKLQGNLNGNQE